MANAKSVPFWTFDNCTLTAAVLLPPLWALVFGFGWVGMSLVIGQWLGISMIPCFSGERMAENVRGLTPAVATLGLFVAIAIMGLRYPIG